MKNTHRFQYIITGWNGFDSIMFLDKKEGNILWHHTYGTLFPTYQSARNALDRTKRFAKRSAHAWELDKCKIIKVEALK